MNIYVDSLHLHLGDTAALASAITQGFQVLCGTITTEGTDMSAALDRLTEEVAQTRTVTQSAITLMRGLADQIREHLNDTAALTQLADDLDANEQTLGQAVADNTPTPPVP